MEILVAFAVVYMFSLLVVVLLFGFSACQEVRDEENRVEEIKCRIKSIDDFYAIANEAREELCKGVIHSAWQNGEFLEIVNPLFGQIQVKIKDIFANTIWKNCDNVQLVTFNPLKQEAVFKWDNNFIKVSASAIMNIYYKQESKNEQK